jgi:hypothetical protein
MDAAKKNSYLLSLCMCLTRASNGEAWQEALLQSILLAGALYKSCIVRGNNFVEKSQFSRLLLQKGSHYFSFSGMAAQY